MRCGVIQSNRFRKQVNRHDIVWWAIIILTFIKSKKTQKKIFGWFIRKDFLTGSIWKLIHCKGRSRDSPSWSITLAGCVLFKLSTGAHFTDGLTLIPAWISKCIRYTVWDQITYPFPDFNGATVHEWYAISSHTPPKKVLGHSLSCGSLGDHQIWNAIFRQPNVVAWWKLAWVYPISPSLRKPCCLNVIGTMYIYLSHKTMV